jgi:hypothetical protein
MHFNLLKDGKIDICKEPPYSEACQESSRWLKDVSVVSNDLFMGRQYTRPKHASMPQVEAVPTEEAKPPINVSVPE